jgi:vesicle-fusing ATPase
VNGPEVLDKYVGGSEEKIRELFKDAEKEQKEMGDASQLHVIIFDEMDAIMKTRGSTRDSTGVADSIVNQLLSKIDGVDSLNNILIIGMTNRKDMIDEAVLRPGRLELHVEIGLPDTAGRLQIINIHTSKMRKNNRMTEAAINHLPELAESTKNFTGAEIEGLVRNAASFAFARSINVQDLSSADSSSIKVDWHDFQTALSETTPAFGNKDQVELLSLYRNGIVSYGDSFEAIHTALLKLVNQSRCSARTPLLTVLLEGPAGTGKTALAAKICQDSGFPLIRYLSADSMIGFSEGQKCSVIQKAFVDAYKSSLSIIFIDDIERILEYTPLGPRFSNVVLQTLIVYLKKVPPNADRRLMVVGTTSIAHLLEDLQLTQTFNVSLHVSMLQQPSEIVSVLKNFCALTIDELNRIASAITRPIGIKKLLMVLEMVQSSGDDLNPDSFLSCLETCGY